MSGTFSIKIEYGQPVLFYKLEGLRNRVKPVQSIIETETSQHGSVFNCYKKNNGETA